MGDAHAGRSRPRSRAARPRPPSSRLQFLGPRRPSEIKSEAFECGNPATGPAWGRFSVKFYLTAILFIVFDVEVVFLYPWALLFRRLGMFGFIEMMLFVVILTLGLVYVWRKGALEWD